ncbi:MAG: tetraacyldisaccharide 4'-kinase [Methylobacteriaceae bacterium]|nr:tetraacyldisaccharide 4'-kinase [Methylobacteriaceae bacterium]
MQAPDFWMRPRPGVAARLLQPFAALYGALARRRLAGPATRAGAPVICLGNFTLGGAGKTPAALALGARLAARGERVAFLSRGYRGALSGLEPVRVDPERHDAAAVGDEPLLLARLAPTFICADRLAGARAAIAAGASVVVMDDGLQNPALAKDLSILVVDSGVGFGNGLTLPAGPLRAPLAAQWPLVDAVLAIGEGAAGAAILAEAAARGLPTLSARMTPDPAAVAALRGAPLLAFAGIARPQKFFDTLAAAGLEIGATATFPDHHAYALGEIESLARRAAQEGLRLVTSEKDLMRLSPAARAAGAAAGLTALPATLDFFAGDLDALLARALASGAAGG